MGVDKSDMKMSVIVPSLNEGGYIGKTLECLRKQTFDDFEIIVVDGNSKDNTRDVAREYTDRVFHIRRGGVPVARNYGAKKARGIFLAHTDADCVIPRYWLEKMHDDFQKNDVEMVWGPVYFDDKATLLARKQMILFWGMYQFVWKYVTWVSNPNLAFTKKGFNKINGYRLDISFMDDYDIGVRGRKELNSYFNPENSVIYSGRRLNSVSLLIEEVLRYMKGFVEYKFTNSISERFVPSNNLPKTPKHNN